MNLKDMVWVRAAFTSAVRVLGEDPGKSCNVAITVQNLSIEDLRPGSARTHGRKELAEIRWLNNDALRIAGNGSRPFAALLKATPKTVRLGL